MTPLPNMLSHLYHSLALPSVRLTLILAWILGAGLLINGLWRLWLKARHPDRLLSASGTALRLVGGAVIAAFPAWLAAAGQSVFDTIDGPGRLLSHLAPQAAGSAEARRLWDFISWAATLFGAWCFIWSWIVLARAAEPTNPHLRWEQGVLQMLFGLLLYFNAFWLDALARSAGLIN